MPTIADYLRVSRAKHDEFHLHQQNGRKEESLASLREAQFARVQAETIDPEHTDGAWASDKAPSAGILNFFQLYLEKHG